MPWPTTAELTTFLQASHLVSVPPTALENLIDFSGILDTGIERWEGLTGFSPYLSSGQTETRAYRSPWPANILDLYGGLLAITSLTVDVTNTISSGTSYTAGLHYRLHPRDAAQRKVPWTQIEFMWSPGCPADGEIEIAGIWGYTTEANLLSSAKRAVLALAAMEALPQVNAAIAQGLLRWTEGDVTKQFAAGDAIANGWQALVDKALAASPRQFRVGAA